jgi:hypothetical protein
VIVPNGFGSVVVKPVLFVGPHAAFPVPEIAAFSVFVTLIMVCEPADSATMNAR